MERSEEWILGDPAKPVPEKTRARPRARPKRRGGSLGRSFLFLVWTVTFLIGIAGVTAFATGVLRDGSFADASLSIDLAHAGDWAAVEFRPWVPGRYLLYVVTDDRSDREARLTFGGRLYARIVASDGRVEMLERFEPPGLGHELNGGEQWTRLAELYIVAPTYEPWTLAVRVADGDPAFAEMASSVHLRRDRKAAGMEGLSNYAFAGPAMICLGVSILAAVWLARRGGTWMPALLSLAASGAGGALYLLVRDGV